MKGFTLPYAGSHSPVYTCLKVKFPHSLCFAHTTCFDGQIKSGIFYFSLNNKICRCSEITKIHMLLQTNSCLITLLMLHLKTKLYFDFYFMTFSTIEGLKHNLKFNPCFLGCIFKQKTRSETSCFSQDDSLVPTVDTLCD